MGRASLIAFCILVGCTSAEPRPRAARSSEAQVSLDDVGLLPEGDPYARAIRGDLVIEAIPVSLKVLGGVPGTLDVIFRVRGGRARELRFDLEPAEAIERVEIVGDLDVHDDGDEQDLVVQLAYATPRGDAMRLGTFALSFRNQQGGDERVRLVIEPSVGVTTDPGAVMASTNEFVQERVEEVRVAAREPASQPFE